MVSFSIEEGGAINRQGIKENLGAREERKWTTQRARYIPYIVMLTRIPHDSRECLSITLVIITLEFTITFQGTYLSLLSYMSKLRFWEAK